MLPYRMLRRTDVRPYMTYLLLLINVMFFIWELTVPDAKLFATFTNIGVVGCQVATDLWNPKTWLDMTRSMFLHAGFAHILGNMLYLLLFGPSIEEYFGKWRFLLFYLMAGFAATFTHIGIMSATTGNMGCALPMPNTPLLGLPPGYVPLIGASGAIAGLMGAFILLHPGTKVRTLFPIFWGLGPSFNVPALYVLGFWFVLQLFNGILSVGPSGSSGVAFWAHIGGFVVGAIMIFVAMLFKPAPPQNLIDD